MSGLFVDEDIMSDESSTDTELPVDDEIVESIPLVLNSEALQSLHLLQYSGKNCKSAVPIKHTSSSIKPESNFILVRIPLDTGRFFDESKAEEWGINVTHHDHVGVLNKTNGGVYAAKFFNDSSGKRIVLFPVQSTSQLRPLFKYLDDSDNQKMLQKKQDFAEPAAKQTKVHILQSTAKTKASPGDPLANAALGETLRHVRKFDQEEWQSLEWQEENAIPDVIANDHSDVTLTTKQTMDQYIEQLTTYNI